MTDIEWESSTEPLAMLARTGGPHGHRKKRLFAVACCRRLWHAPSTAYLELLSTAERLADGQVGEGFVSEVLRNADRAWGRVDGSPAVAGARMTLSRTGHEAAVLTVHHCIRSEMARILSAIEGEAASHDPVVRQAKAVWDGEIGHERNEQLGWNEVRNVAKAAAEAVARPAILAGFAATLREVTGPSLSPKQLDARWLTPTVLALAEAIYEDRAFDRMPVLADALEEAGCDNADILAHCRVDGVHVRGCWVVDLVLGKE